MRKLIATIFFFTCTFSCVARDWYIATAGNDNTGTGTIGAPIKTINKLNTLWGSVVSGDRILFNRGDLFEGVIRPTKSNITLSAYGTGANPIISVLSLLTGWVNLGGNKWECIPSRALKADFNVLTVNGQAVAVGRTPNANTFFNYTSATTTTLTSPAITIATSYIDAQIVIRASGYQTEKCIVTAQAGNTVTFSNTTQAIDNGNIGTTNNGKAGFGYFFQRFEASLDIQWEWYFNPVTNRVRIYSTTDPNLMTIKASFADTAIALRGQTNMVVDGLEVEGASLYGVQTQASTNVSVINCSFNNNTRAVYGWNTHDLVINNNTINNSFNSAILVSNLTQRKRVTVTGNLITNTGQLTGMGAFPSSNNFKAVIVKTDNASTSDAYVNISRNKIIKTGYDGIEFQGSNVRISKNIIDTFCTAQGDGGAIYTWINNSTINTIDYVNRLIDSNFCSNGIGDAAGSGGQIQVNGIYMDDQTRNIVMVGNTVWNIPGNGVSANNPLNQRFSYNTIYNCNVAYSIVQKKVGPLANNFVTQNVLYQKLNTQFNFFHNNDNLSQPPPAITITQSMQRMAYIDSNWISNSSSTGGYRYYYSSDGVTYTFPPPATLLAWINTYIHDTKSILPPTILNNTNTALYINESDNYVDSVFTGFQKIAPDGTVYNNFITLAPWSSKVLINNGAAPPVNKFPTATPEPDKTITLPVNSTTLMGIGADEDGFISLYSWTFKSGPNTPTITPASSTTSGTATVSGLIQGEYQFEFAVKDNSGAITKSTMKVTVNAAIPNTPPTVDAQPDVQTITLPVNGVILTSTGTNGSGTIPSWSWTQVGTTPTIATILTPNSGSTTVQNLNVPGKYFFKLVRKNNLGDSAVDQVQVNVNPAVIPPNQNPVARIVVSPSNNITLPTSTINLDGTTSTDADGTIDLYTWEQTSGPSVAVLTSPTTATTNASNLIQGIYGFKLTVKDNSDSIDSKVVTITVNPAPILNPPTVDAGESRQILVSQDTVHLVGVATQGSGTITSHTWSKIDGPSTYTISDPSQYNITVFGLVVGDYTFKLEVTDSNGFTRFDLVTLSVRPKPSETIRLFLGYIR